MSAWAQPVLHTVSLEQLLGRADQHPEVRIAGADVEIASGAVMAADRAPLPAVSASIGSVDLQNGIGPGSWAGGKRLDKALGVDWVWERGEKRLHRTRQAERSLDAAAFDRGDILLTRRIAISAAFWELLAAQDREVDSSMMLRSAEQMASAARLRLEKGDISEQEAARVFIETERTRSDHAALNAARHLAAVSLAQAAALASDQIEAQGGWPALPAATQLNPVQQAGRRSTDARVPARELDEMINNRSDVRAARSRLEAARAALDLARSLQVPDITWGGGVNNYPPDHRASVQLRAQFPWQINYRFEGEIRQAIAGLQRADEALRQTLLAAESELSALHFRRIAAAQRLEGFETQILSRSQQVLDRAEAAYNRGATSLTDLLDARRTFRTVRLDSIQARLEAARAETEWRLRANLTTP